MRREMSDKCFGIEEGLREIEQIERIEGIEN